MRHAVAQTMIRLAEGGHLSDELIRAGMRWVIGRRLAAEDAANPGTEAVAARLAEGPIVVAPAQANEQHYEVPAGFYEAFLGPRLKYSSCLWEGGIADVGAAEEAMLALTTARAEVADGHRILDLGCGWGSFTLWAAEKLPRSEVVAVSNSRPQGDYIRRRAARHGLTNVAVETADVAEYEPSGTFDRIVSVEMFEHIRNHEPIFRKAAGWLEPDGAMFVHVFAHARHAYPYEVRGPGDWMATRFFTGGLMPSRELLPRQALGAMALARQWSVGGSHYQRTLDAWLDRLDANRFQAERALAAAVHDVDLEIQRWRMFLMACSELFGHRNGTEWGVEHYLFTP